MRYPELWGNWFWTLRFCAVSRLAPGQISVGDQIARRWTDISLDGQPTHEAEGSTHVKYVYYSILASTAVWGLLVLWKFPALQIARSARC